MRAKPPNSDDNAATTATVTIDSFSSPTGMLPASRTRKVAVGEFGIHGRALNKYKCCLVCTALGSGSVYVLYIRRLWAVDTSMPHTPQNRPQTHIQIHTDRHTDTHTHTHGQASDVPAPPPPPPPIQGRGGGGGESGQGSQRAGILGKPYASHKPCSVGRVPVFD